MSQIYKSIASGPIPPAIPTQFTADDATIAIPVANNLNVFSRDTTANNINGIETTADPNGSANLYVELTNRLQGTTTTVGAATSTIITFPLGATPASYVFQLNLTAFDTVTPSATSWWFLCAARTTGVAATSLGSDEDFLEDAGLAASDVNIVIAGNSVLIQVVGVAGVTLNWSAVGYYVRAT